MSMASDEFKVFFKYGDVSAQEVILKQGATGKDLKVAIAEKLERNVSTIKVFGQDGTKEVQLTNKDLLIPGATYKVRTQTNVPLGVRSQRRQDARAGARMANAEQTEHIVGELQVAKGDIIDTVKEEVSKVLARLPGLPDLTEPKEVQAMRVEASIQQQRALSISLKADAKQEAYDRKRAAELKRAETPAKKAKQAKADLLGQAVKDAFDEAYRKAKLEAYAAAELQAYNDAKAKAYDDAKALLWATDYKAAYVKAYEELVVFKEVPDVSSVSSDSSDSSDSK